MKINFLALLVAVLSTTTVFSQSNEIKFEEYTLENGLHVILHQDASTPIVAVSVLYHVGSKNENPERTGFAHFFEHLLFEGSENIGRGEFDRYVNERGGTNNAYTSSDVTYYHEVFPSNELPMALWLESERMLHAKVEQKGIEVQREVVKEEKRQRYDNAPYMSFLPEMSKRMFKQHPYRWVPIGDLEHLNAASEEDYKSFYKTFYVPNNATLSIAGDIDLDEAKVLIKKYFSTIPKGTHDIPRPEANEPALEAVVVDTVYDNIQLPAVFYGYHSPAMGTKDYYASKMLSTLLTDGESSRMNKSLVDEQQVALQVINFDMDTEHPGIIFVIGIANMGVELNTLKMSMDKEIERIQNEPMTDFEFQKLRNKMESSFIQSNSTMAGIAESLATYHNFYKDASLINTELDRYLAVTKEDIQRVAKEYLKNDSRVILDYLPKQ